ncbi:MAG: DUF4450 domain-containing protein [Bacteroidales bacterium]|nr:DUF4450 domain-containing protein [Bacteroidales bacterium]
MNTYIRRPLVAIISIIICLNALSQSRIGDFIESRSLNTDKRNAARYVNYWPEDDAFTTENGTNRYTRALYGGFSEFRLETSDRPVFATYKKQDKRNIAFLITYNEAQLNLADVDLCRSQYSGGKRTYKLSHKAWGDDAYVCIETLVAYDAERPLWHFHKYNMHADAALTSVVKPIKKPKLNRSGDLGQNPVDAYDAHPDSAANFCADFHFDGDDIYLAYDADAKRLSEVSREVFDAVERERTTLASRIQFSTPEAWVNLLDDNLIAAADGNWDGDTWLHGAIGWRMQLAGWRAGYLGDVLGWTDRAQSHFNAYAESQVTDVEPTIPHPAQDTAMNLARAQKKWGTQMYSNGYICRYPHRHDNMHHYDMNLNFVDELLWHFQYDATPDTLRRYWPLLVRHLAWEKRNFDPDDDGLYDAYCCIWASDALYYSGGAVTHSTAYNLRALRLAARIAEIIGEDATYYAAEAQKTAAALDKYLWDSDGQHWAEYRDALGLQRTHTDAAIWSIYTPINCGVGTEAQQFEATKYVDRNIPHIPVVCVGEAHGLLSRDTLYTISTSDWMPYSWSINNVACAEVYNMALAYFEANRPDEGFRLLKANIIDNMYMGASPANFGQISFYDAARGECYRDFGDVVGVGARAIINGLWGIIPQALYGKLLIKPGFPAEWDSASIRTPYVSYDFHREGDTCIFNITQNLPQQLTVTVSMLSADGMATQLGTDAKQQTIKLYSPRRNAEHTYYARTPSTIDILTPDEQKAAASAIINTNKYKKFQQLDLRSIYNDSVTNIFKHKYLSPRPQSTTLQIPVQGIGEWCHPQLTAEISDSAMRAKDVFATNIGIGFKVARTGNNVAFCSLWDNFPSSITIPAKGKFGAAYIFMAGSTNHMQFRMANAQIVATYTDGTADTLALIPPYNYAPIEQDYYIDGKAFRLVSKKQYRVCIQTGVTTQEPIADCPDVYGRPIPGGAGQIVEMLLDARKALKSIRLEALANDVVVGVLGITLAR